MEFFCIVAINTTATTVTTVLASSKGKSLTFAPMPHRRLITADHFEMLEYPFITLNQLPSGFIQHLGKILFLFLYRKWFVCKLRVFSIFYNGFELGGTVSARSVKLLERISNLDEPESRGKSTCFILNWFLVFYCNFIDVLLY